MQEATRGRMIWEGHRPAWPKFQPQRGVLGRWLRGRVVVGTARCDGECGSVLGQAGGRPSHPQRAAARLRDLGGPIVPHGPNFSRNAAFSEDGCEGASLWERCVVMAKAVQSWVKPTEAPGGAEEAHRRWPEGRSEQGASEQGASEAKVDPPIHNALPRACLKL
jgi:hypothetical protein